MSHVSKTWGDPARDAEIPGLDGLAARYGYQQLMAWIMDHPEVAAVSYSEKFNGRWNEAAVVGVSVAETGVLQMLFRSETKVENVGMPQGSLEVTNQLETLNHQLASVVVASFPPEKYKDEVGIPRQRPSVCDNNGLVGPNRQFIPYLDPTSNKATHHGGPIYQAYNTSGGTETVVSRIETVLNKPAEGTPLQEHLGLVRILEKKHRDLKAVAKFPTWYEPFTQMSLFPGKPPVAQLRLLQEIHYKPYKTLDSHYLAYAYMSTTNGVSRRAAYVHDGHYFADMPPGMAGKVHRLNNLMNLVSYLASPGISLSSVPRAIQGLKTLLPLNLPCFTLGAGAKLSKESVAGYDQRFKPGIFLHPPARTPRVIVFRDFVNDRPMFKAGKIVYSPANPQAVIADSVKQFPAHASTVVFVVIAHASLWDDELNFIMPFDMLTGEVLVARGMEICNALAGHMKYGEYLAKASYFMQSRTVYPYSRISWPQLNGEPFSKILLKHGDVSASDTAYSLMKAQLSDEAYKWAPSDLYVGLKDTPILPPKASAALIKKPLVEPVVVSPSDIDYEEGGEDEWGGVSAAGPIGVEEGEDEDAMLAAMTNILENGQ